MDDGAGGLEKDPIFFHRPEGEEMWGWTEETGWKQREDVGLADLGELAESQYRLLDSAGGEGTKK